MVVMNIARAFDRILRRQLNLSAAWVPAVTAFRLGDYGLWRSGVFVALGNVREFGVDIAAIEGEAGRLDFVSEDARLVELSAGLAAGSDLEAGLAIELPRETSFILKCPALRSRRIANIAEVVRGLHAAYRRGGAERWRLRYKVVGELLSADDLTLLATRTSGTRVTLRGRAEALRRFHAGTLDASLGVHADHQLALDLRNVAGPVALGLFRVNVRGVASLSFAADARAVGPVDLVDDSMAEPLAAVCDDDTPDDDDDDDDASGRA